MCTSPWSWALLTLFYLSQQWCTSLGELNSSTVIWTTILNFYTAANECQSHRVILLLVDIQHGMSDVSHECVQMDSWTCVEKLACNFFYISFAEYNYVLTLTW